MLQVLQGLSVVPHQCDDAEQHRRRAKDDPSVQRRFHTQKVTDISKSGGINRIRILLAMQMLSGLEQCSVTLPQMHQGSMSEIAIFRQVTKIACVLPRCCGPSHPTALQVLLDEAGTQVNVELYEW